MSSDLKKILFSLTKPHVDNKRKNKNFELLPKGKMAVKGKEVINSTPKLIRELMLQMKRFLDII
jgi:hypothetical protein